MDDSLEGMQRSFSDKEIRRLSNMIHAGPRRGRALKIDYQTVPTVELRKNTLLGDNDDIEIGLSNEEAVDTTGFRARRLIGWVIDQETGLFLIGDDSDVDDSLINKQVSLASYDRPDESATSFPFHPGIILPGYAVAVDLEGRNFEGQAESRLYLSNRFTSFMANSVEIFNIVEG